MSALILYHENGTVTGLSEAALGLKEQALSPLALISVIKSKDTNALVSAAVQTIHDLLCDIDKAFDEAKEPALRECQRLDKLRREITHELVDEKTRGNAMCGDWQQHEQAKLKDAILAQNKQLTELEQKRFSALSKVETEDERDLVNLNFAQQAAAVPPPPVVTAPGQSVKMEWVIEDQTQEELLLLANANLSLVNIMARKTEIKASLDLMQSAGVTNPTLPGVRAEKKAVNKNRKSREQKPIDV